MCKETTEKYVAVRNPIGFMHQYRKISKTCAYIFLIKECQRTVGWMYLFQKNVYSERYLKKNNRSSKKEARGLQSF